MSHWGSVPRTGLASFLMHLCAALVDRVAFPGSVRRASRVRRKVEKAKLLASFLMHLCAALVDRDAFFGRNFGAVFEHAKTLIREEHYTAMSHWRMKIVGMWIFAKSWETFDFGGMPPKSIRWIFAMIRGS